MKGLREGFRIGFRNEPNRLGSAASNMQSASMRPSVICEFLYAKLKAGRVLGPVGPSPVASIQVNHLVKFQNNISQSNGQ